MAPEMEATTNPVIYGFTGRQYEPGTGLYYYRNRMFDSESGRFMTKDPLGIRGGDVNLYRYVQNSPFAFNDPFGLLGVTVSTGAAVGIAESPQSSTGQVVEASSGFAVGTDQGSFKFDGFISSGSGTNIAGGTAGAGLNVGFYYDNMSDLNGPGQNVTYVLGPFSITNSQSSTGESLGWSMSVGGKGAGLSEYRTTTTTIFGGGCP